MDKRRLGQAGEDQATAALKKDGYRIIERNYRNRFGEIDIIAEEGEYLVFVEVKKRSTAAFGDPLHAINIAKRRHIIRSAMFYLKANRSFDRRIRFDVVGIERDKVRIVKHAFTLDE